MDRQIVYSGQILPETTLLQMTKDAMIGLAKLSAAVLGTSTAVNGFAVTPTSPASLQVYVAPGEIYSLQNIDGTVFSSLAADTTHQILKQGILLDQATLSCPAPATAGQSINYLIEATYQDSDANPVLLPYYNSTPPNTPFSGQGNNGLTQPTARKGTVVLTAKAGVPATTGSQTTPAPDSGNVGLYVVTVAYGQTQIVAGNISQYAAAPFINMVNMGQIQAQTGTAFPTGGTAPNYTVAPSPVPAALTDKLRFNVTFGAAGTTGSNTINITLASGTTGAIALKQYDSNGNLVPAVVPSTGFNSDVQYNLANNCCILLDPVMVQPNQIQPISASVASNALTVTLNPTSLTFRSSTLSNGAVTTLTNSAALSLTVPSGATLGSTNGVAATYAVLAINNNGTEQLGIVNMAGGISLDENGLISATAISAGATSASTIYSSSAVTNMPFRVAGYVTATEATAGTWATAPSQVQGASVSLQGFGSSLAANGYQKLPNGLIVQWGKVTISSFSANTLATAAITWPVAFPNNVFVAIASLSAGLNTTGYSQCDIESATTTGATGKYVGASSGSNAVINYIAIGD
ncbi:gp53-like domain-containing protein [Aquitalea aquatilis]|uniref:gp53-like domain-containing protein n=1 Tax=Aquitalea aquatilis TaxID=1537400 RepID=UPI0010BDD5B6|nr:hypothetical protein [Aquitalea aquatilis]